MTINFPQGVTDGYRYSQDGRTWEWRSPRWMDVPVEIGGGGPGGGIPEPTEAGNFLRNGVNHQWVAGLATSGGNINGPFNVRGEFLVHDGWIETTVPFVLGQPAGGPGQAVRLDQAQTLIANAISELGDVEGGGAFNIHRGDTPPENPALHPLWWNRATLLVWNDPEWVIAVNPRFTEMGQPGGTGLRNNLRVLYMPSEGLIDLSGNNGPPLQHLAGEGGLVNSSWGLACAAHYQTAFSGPPAWQISGEMTLLALVELSGTPESFGSIAGMFYNNPPMPPWAPYLLHWPASGSAANFSFDTHGYEGFIISANAMPSGPTALVVRGYFSSTSPGQFEYWKNGNFEGMHSIGIGPPNYSYMPLACRVGGSPQATVAGFAAWSRRLSDQEIQAVSESPRLMLQTPT